ncbi:MAG: ATP-binding cassette domain-containing protein [Balneolaceae bacterium]|nr:ATP-binding cassette domain-containing protein [Balneolaceae bacterium]
MPNEIFTVRNLTKFYQMGEVQVRALQGVDLELFSGELVVLLDASGSGKSTLVNILGGLDTATGGRLCTTMWTLPTPPNASSPPTVG